MNNPDLDLLYQFTDLRENHNKKWRVQAWERSDGTYDVTTTFSRVGYEDQVSKRPEPYTKRKLDSLIRSKERKGYQKVDTTTTQGVVNIAGLDRATDTLIKMLFEEAGEYINSYLATSVESLSPEQIEEGRRLLGFIQQLYYVWHETQDKAIFTPLVDAVQEYYTAIPTQLPAKIKAEETVEALCKNFREQEERLEQLGAAIISGGATGDMIDVVGARILVLDSESQEHRAIESLVLNSIGHRNYRGARIDNIFTIEIPDERKAFEAYSATHVKRLFHGTRNPNCRHILRTGLVLPKTKAHGWMFGPGIYFADTSSKSMQYCDSSSGLNVLFVADVSLGKPYIAPDAKNDLRHAPAGYDSVFGKAGHTRSWGGKLNYNEFIVYQQCQQTITHLVTWR